MRNTHRVSFVASLLVVALLTIPFSAQAGDIIINHFGFLYETGGFPTSAAGDQLTGVGILTNVNPSVGWNFATDEFTWIIKDLVSMGQTSPDGGRTLIINYQGGSIGLYNDPAMNHDWGVNPPNATSPSSFEDGDQILIGAFTQFVMMYDTVYNIGSYQGVVSFTGGTSLANLPEPNGLVFAGTIGPQWDPNIPDGYSLESVGRIIAPHLCAVQGHVDFECVPSACVNCIGITELVLNYTGTEDINTATLDCGTLAIQGNQLIITPQAGDDMLPKEIEVAVGMDYAIIHTSCSQPIEPGNVIEQFVVSFVDKTLVPCEDMMCNGVTRLVLLYFGPGDPGDVIVSDNLTVSVAGDLITITPEAGHDALKGNTTVSIGCDAATIHTSCSQPLEVGFVYGNYEVFGLDVIPGDGTGVFPSGGPIVGATIDLVDNEGNIFSTMTDGNGDYFFNDVAGETLRVSITVPLGYLPSSETSVVRVVQPGDVTSADFHFVCEGTLDEPRSTGFWKHQV
ncbi:MAG: carboxypeptidase-like regulatory domain-containing protein, partial [Candidatus Latescibacterota bacterium]